MSVYIHLYHGRNNPAEDMDDWGFEGPVIGPLAYVHVTYLCDVKFACTPEVFRKFWPVQAAAWDEKGYSNMNGPLVDYNFKIHEDLIEYDGKFYGDWSIASSADIAENFQLAEELRV